MCCYIFNSFALPFRFVQQQQQIPQQIQQQHQQTNTLAGLQQKLALLTTSSTDMASAAGVVAQPTSATQPSFQSQQFVAVQKSSFDSPLTYVIINVFLELSC